MACGGDAGPAGGGGLERPAEAPVGLGLKLASLLMSHCVNPEAPPFDVSFCP